MVVDRKYRKALALPCLMSEPLPNAANSSNILRFDSMQYASYASYCVTINKGVFLGKMCSDGRKNHGCGNKKPEGTSPARFGLRTAANNKDEVVELLPSTKKTTEYSFELLLSIYTYLIFFLKFKTSKNLFFKSNDGHPGKKTPVAQKHRAVSRQEKMTFSTPSRSGCLGTPLPLPQSLYGRAGGRAYTDVTTKIYRIDRLPNLLCNGAPLAR